MDRPARMARHDWRRAPVDMPAYLASGLPAKTMGRALMEDPLFFGAALAGGSVLAELCEQTDSLVESHAEGRRGRHSEGKREDRAVGQLEGGADGKREDRAVGQLEGGADGKREDRVEGQLESQGKVV